MCVCVCVCVCVCQSKIKDRADGMRGKSGHFPRRDSNLYLWDMRPSCFRVCVSQLIGHFKRQFKSRKSRSEENSVCSKKQKKKPK